MLGQLIKITQLDIFMKKRVSLYLIAMLGVLSLQSCVSNYVVSNPIEYKTDAKLASINQYKLAEAKKEIANSTDPQAVAVIKLDKTQVQNAISDILKRENTIDDILKEAYTYIGTPYRYGGTTRSGIDCSAFVLSVFGENGVDLPRVAAAQAKEGESISKQDLKKGDLVFFSHRGRGRISHVGIVEEVTPEGDVKFIHSATSKGVMISSLEDNYWGPRFTYAKRIITD